MYPFVSVLVGIPIAALLLVIFNFRFLLYPVVPSLNPIRNAKRLTLDGSSLFISDLHLKAHRPFQYSDSIRRVLQERNVSNLIVVGDLFDSPEDGRIIARECAGATIADILGVRDSPVKAFFVEGSPPHDPSSKETATLNALPLQQLGRCAILDFKKMTVVAYHGHDLSWKGAVGHAWDRFVSPLSLERAWKRLAGVPHSNWVVLGHTHIPGIDVQHRVANCGGWQRVRFLVSPACSGIFLSPEESSLELVNFAR